MTGSCQIPNAIKVYADAYTYLASGLGELWVEVENLADALMLAIEAATRGLDREVECGEEAEMPVVGRVKGFRAARGSVALYVENDEGGITVTSLPVLIAELAARAPLGEPYQSAFYALLDYTVKTASKCGLQRLATALNLVKKTAEKLF